MTIVHISADFPDSIQPQKTHAIKNLIDATSTDLDHFVYSLNRLGIPLTKSGNGRLTRRSTVTRRNDFDYGTGWVYRAPAHGILLATMLRRLADLICEDILDRGLQPSLIHGHKLSIEGIVAQRVAEQFDVPFGISIQGNTDSRIIHIRRDLWPQYRRIFHDAAIVFPFTPWALDFVEARLGGRSGNTCLLPCLTPQDQIIPPSSTPPHLMSAFHLKNWRLKNLPMLVRGAREVHRYDHDFRLNIIGGGDPTTISTVEKLLEGNHFTTLVGEVPSATIQQIMNRHAGFAMISKRESYGMVFLEALLAGCPVAYPRNAAIDGYFDGHDFAISVSPKEQGEVTDAMARLVREQHMLKKQLAVWQQSGAAARFQTDAIATSFRSGLIDAATPDGTASAP